MTAELSSIIIMLATAILIALAAVFIKIGMYNVTYSLSSLIKNKNLWFGSFLLVLVAIGTIIAYKGGNLSVLYPIGATSYVWSVLFGHIFFKEKLNVRKILGVLIIVLGVTLISVGAGL
ncbi:MAG: EamA family transporter [Candidatus Woesearchaeota archaeon]|nr:MAG: EamA family transporter [Candidatus Woesearchaeota archaeon]